MTARCELGSSRKEDKANILRRKTSPPSRTVVARKPGSSNIIVGLIFIPILSHNNPVILDELYFMYYLCLFDYPLA